MATQPCNNCQNGNHHDLQDVEDCSCSCSNLVRGNNLEQNTHDLGNRRHLY